jgi:transcriptional regulator with XRE-family HTH domain
MFDHLGDALTVLRLLRRLSQSELAERAGIQSNQVSRYEKGTVQPQLSQLTKLLEALGVDLTDFVFALASVQRLQGKLSTAADRESPERLAAHAAVAYWQQTVDRHVALADRVTQLVQHHLGGDAGHE